MSRLNGKSWGSSFVVCSTRSSMGVVADARLMFTGPSWPCNETSISPFVLRPLLGGTSLSDYQGGIGVSSIEPRVRKVAHYLQHVGQHSIP